VTNVSGRAKNARNANEWPSSKRTFCVSVCVDAEAPCDGASFLLDLLFTGGSLAVGLLHGNRCGSDPQCSCHALSNWAKRKSKFTKKFQIKAESMEYFEPRSVSEALSVLAKHGAEAKIIAGGTDVMVDIKFKEEPGGLVNIKKIPGLSGISGNGAGVRIGPLTTIREIETSALVRDKLPVLWEAAHQFASLQVRNTATIGGNICRASPSGETLAPLLVLDAKAKLVFSDGEKIIPFTSFFQGPGKSSAGNNGLLTEIEISYPPANSKGAYLKHAVRGAMDIAMVGVAVLMTTDSGKNNVQDVRIGLGAVAPTPVRAAKAEALLRGKPLTASLVREAAALAASESSPIDDQRSSAEYRRWIVEALTRKGLEQTWKAAAGKEIG
jgi:carbon-monoxide dehydrogenase medium subunit